MDKYCSLGARIWYQRNTVGDHGTESASGVPRAFSFLASVFANIYFLDGCKVENITDLVV